MGQWAMLLGYAGLPWVLRELTVRSGRISPGRLALAVLPAAIGGFAAMSITILAALPAALCHRNPTTQPAEPPPPRQPAPDQPAPDQSLHQPHPAHQPHGPHRPRQPRLEGRFELARRGLVTLGVLGVASLPWAIPSLLVPVLADPSGATAFAARADTPFGTAGSLLMLGGIWNSQAVPVGYGGFGAVVWLLVVIAAVAGYLIWARPHRVCPGLGVAAIAGFCVAAIGSWAPTLAALRAAIAFWPGFALLRDGQQFVAPLALAESIGLASAVTTLILAVRPALTPLRSLQPLQHPRSQPTQPDLAQADAQRADPAQPRSPEPHRCDIAGVIAPAMSHRWGRAREPGADEAQVGGMRGVSGSRGRGRGADGGSLGVVIGFIALLAPVVLLPGLAWGGVGRLRAVQYPADWLTARSYLDGSGQPGSVLLLPWAQYRRYPWNRGEPVFDPWPRLLARSMIWNDALTVGTTTVAAETPLARRLGPEISSGRLRTEALLGAGVRYVIIDAGPILGRPRARLATLARLPGARVVLASRDLIVFRLPGR